MVEKVYIDSFDETYCLVFSDDRGVLHELNEYFSFMVPNAKFMPAFQNKVWDGKIRLYNGLTGRIYKGLIPYIEKFCTDRSYQCIKNPNLTIPAKSFDVDNFVSTLGLKLVPYDEQKKAIKHAIETDRCVLLSPTSSGKSLIQYAITRYHFDRFDKKILIVVPTVNLVKQMYGDFEDYSDNFDVEKNIHLIYEGQAKTSDKKIFISTWQSIYKLRKPFFDQFHMIMMDECHTMKADAIKSVMEKASNTSVRIGLTGTLDDSECHRLIIEGLTGPTFTVTTTKELMDQGKISKLDIVAAVLKYPESDRKANKKFTYPEEMKFIVNHPGRSKFISKIINLQDKRSNVLVLTAFINHIKILKDEIEKNTGRKVYCVSGSVESDDREAIRKIAEANENIVIIATYGVYSTGVNIKNLQYIIKATPSKSVVRVLQSIGRGLRKDGKSNRVKVIDLIDDFGHNGNKNYLFKQFFVRVQIYINQKFSYEIKNINI